jgi:hypothetical protein
MNLSQRVRELVAARKKGDSTGALVQKSFKTQLEPDLVPLVACGREPHWICTGPRYCVRVLRARQCIAECERTRFWEAIQLSSGKTKRGTKHEGGKDTETCREFSAGKQGGNGYRKVCDCQGGTRPHWATNTRDFSQAHW